MPALQADVYATGVLMWQAVCGESPFAGVMGIYRSAVPGPPPQHYMASHVGKSKTGLIPSRSGRSGAADSDRKEIPIRGADVDPDSGAEARMEVRENQGGDFDLGSRVRFQSRFRGQPIRGEFQSDPRFRSGAGHACQCVPVLWPGPCASTWHSEIVACAQACTANCAEVCA